MCEHVQACAAIFHSFSKPRKTYECIYTNTFTSKLSSGLDKPSPKLLGQDRLELTNRGLNKPRTQILYHLYGVFASYVSRGQSKPRLITSRINGPIAMVAKFLDDNKRKIHLKENSPYFKLHRSYSISFNLSNVGGMSGVESKRIVP